MNKLYKALKILQDECKQHVETCKTCPLYIEGCILRWYNFQTLNINQFKNKEVKAGGIDE